MRQINDCLKIQVKQDGIWHQVHMEQLDTGDIVRLVKPDGSFATDEKGKTEFILTSTPLMNVNED